MTIGPTPPSQPPPPPPPPGWEPGSPPPQPGWAPSMPPPPSRGPAAGYAYGGFWIRFLAWLVDAVVVTVVLAVIGRYTDIGFQVHTGDSATVGTTYYQSYYGVTLTNPLPVLIAGVYFVLWWGLAHTTPGMAIFRMSIRRFDTGTPPGLARALGRYLGMVLAAIPIFLGLMWAGWDWHKQGWHDKLARTVVVRPTGWR